ncbi:hypothetical protein DNTS_005234 [Danionella cerebrum]|uniref:MBD domain-containing protein n=1 Tax=Danionella cerebrum TaxID=2873325 RepID=A0A553QDE8_9TELE|nr:hypothetical protein DNTS_005234 [Danionella translucida]TRY87947.1 hypothetical protein DNTS_005234 [Danionella translucida]
MERKRTDCPALPPGWKKEEVIRKSGLSAGKSDVYYYSPTGKKFRSKPQLSRYLGNQVDLACFDFRTGKMMPSKLQKNKQRRSDSLSINKGKPDLNTALPIRQTASIFKQPVTKVVNHPNNKVKTDLQRATEQPRQLFWEKRLKGLRSWDVTDEVLRTMDLPKALQSMVPEASEHTLLSALASALHSGCIPITGQTSNAAEKNPSVWMNSTQPLCRAFSISEQDIRSVRQTDSARETAETLSDRDVSLKSDQAPQLLSTVMNRAGAVEKLRALLSR